MPGRKNERGYQLLARTTAPFSRAARSGKPWPIGLESPAATWLSRICAPQLEQHLRVELGHFQPVEAVGF